MREIGSFTSPQAWHRFSVLYEQAWSLCPPLDRQLDVDTRFGSTRVYRFGDHPRGSEVPIVLIHARGATSVMWAANIAGLAEKRPVYALDVLGEPGRSVQAAPIDGARDTAGWLTEVLTRLDLPEVHLVGGSNGAWLALNQAVRAPERLASVVLIDPTRGIGHYPIRFAAATILMEFAVPAPFRDRYLRWTAGRPDAHDPRMRLLATGTSGYRIRAETPSYFSDDALRSVTVPTLVMLGGRSVVNTAARVVTRATKLIPTVETTVVPEGTHALSHDFPKLVNERILSFVNRQPTR